MNAQATRPADQERSWRLRRWPNDSTVVHLVFLDHLTIPTPEAVAAATERAHARGATAVRTSALFPRAAEVVLAADYRPIDTLALLRCDLTVGARPHAAPHERADDEPHTRPMRPWHIARAAAVDRAAFGDVWGNDVQGLREIRHATPAYRARIVGPRHRAAGFAVSGAAGLNGYLQRLAVDPAAQRAGYGTALVHDSLAWMRSRHLTSALVNTGIDNAPALALYERLGFTRLDEHLVIAEHRFPT